MCIREDKKPTWGTCAGLILLSQQANASKKGGQELIGGLGVRVHRNHFGRQMESFEAGWGWFYWTWDTEQSPQWSYKKGLAAGILPQKTYQRSFSCSNSIPDFGGMGLAENY